jgi:hypothetical protein
VCACVCVCARARVCMCVCVCARASERVAHLLCFVDQLLLRVEFLLQCLVLLLNLAKFHLKLKCAHVVVADVRECLA